MFNWFTNLFKKEPSLPYPTGHVVPSPTDYRDIPASAAILSEAPVPPVVAPPTNLVQKDQGQTPECVAFAGSTMREFLEKVYGNEIVFDADWLYKQCKLIDGYNGPGTYFRVMLSILKNVGCLPMGGDPNDAALIAKYKINGYVSVNPAPADIRAAIFNFGIVLMAFHGSNGGWQTAYIRAPQQGETIWGHATAGDGYDQTYINGQNSWSKFWGALGKFFVPNNYMPFECWAIVKELPPNWKDLLPNLGNKPKAQFVNDIYFGLNNTDVANLQACLKWIGCLPKDTDTSDPQFGPKTLAAVKLFQQRFGINQTGFVGPMTRDSLNKIFA